MSFDIRRKAVLMFSFVCFAAMNCNTPGLLAQEGQSNQLDGTWTGVFADAVYFVAIKGNEVIVQIEKSFFDEWVNFFEEKTLNVAKGNLKVSGNHVEMTLTHIWGNFFAYTDEELFGDFDYWQTPKDFFTRTGISFDKWMKDYAEIFRASGVISGNRMRLNWNNEVHIITKQGR
jgi:hypothetical protein